MRLTIMEITVSMCFVGVLAIFIAYPTTVHFLCMVVGLLQVINLTLNAEKIKSSIGQKSVDMIRSVIIVLSLLMLGMAIVLFFNSSDDLPNIGMCDIIDLPHHQSPTRAHMSMTDRAAQFSPFAALVGYDTMLDEVRRQTADKRLLSEDEIALLDRKLQFMAQTLSSRHVYAFTFFEPDLLRGGGNYIRYEGIVKRIDTLADRILLEDGTVISISEISDIDSEQFENI